MPATATALENFTYTLVRELHIKSSLAATFAALLEELGPASTGHEGAPMPMVLEPWPGGRWYRDLGDKNGHYWGTVQAIKRNTLLEITGPMFLSLPVVNNIQYRLAEGDGGTKLTLHHSAFGPIPDDFRQHFPTGLDPLLERIRQRAEAAA